MPQQESKPERNTFFEDFGPMHELWMRLERGMQIMLGLALITMFGFLGESWGGENIPYNSIMTAILRVSWAFAISIMTSPVILALGIIAGRTLPLSRRSRGRIYMIVLLAMLAYCWAALYISTGNVIGSLFDATGTAFPYPKP
jgi:hypothetical protein